MASKKARQGGSRRRSHRKELERRKKEETALERGWRSLKMWVKVNERIFWVLLLLLIAPAFAFTGATQSFFQRARGRYPVYEIYGEEITNVDVEMAQRVIQSVSSLRGGVFREGGLSDLDFLALEREADRLGIAVSDDELADEIRTIYQRLRATRDAYSKTPPGQPVDRDYLARRFKDLHEKQAFDHRDWLNLLRLSASGRAGIGHHKLFEAALRRYLKAEKVVRYVHDSVQVSEDEVYDEFLRKGGRRKLSFFQVEPDEAMREKAGADITDKEIETYYNENIESLRVRSPELSVDYVFIPYDAFEKKVEITGEEIEEEYLRTRGERYRRSMLGAGEEAGTFALRPAEKEAELEKKLYRPLEEVRDEVIESLREQKKRQLARELADTLRKRLFPASESGPYRDFEALEKEYPFIEAGSSPWMSRTDVQEKFARYSSSRLQTYFSSLDRNVRESDKSKWVPVEASPTHAQTEDGSGIVFYTSVRTLMPGYPDLDEVRDRVRERLVAERALDLLEKEVDAMVEKIHAGEETFEAAAAARGAHVYTTAYIKRYDTIRVDRPKEDADKADDGAAEKDSAGEEDGGDDAAPEPETESWKLPYALGSAVASAGFAVSETGDKGVTTARVDAEEVIFVVRLEERLDPDPAAYPRERQRYYRTVLSDKRSAYFQKWMAELRKRARITRLGVA